MTIQNNYRLNLRRFSNKDWILALVGNHLEQLNLGDRFSMDQFGKILSLLNDA